MRRCAERRDEEEEDKTVGQGERGRRRKRGGGGEGGGGGRRRKKPRMNPPDKYSSLTDDVRTSPPPLPTYEYTDIISGIDSTQPSVRPDNDDTPSSLVTHETRNTYSR